jgi:hypothetical protein
VKIRNVAHGLDMRFPLESCGFGIVSQKSDSLFSEYQGSAPKRRSHRKIPTP